MAKLPFTKLKLKVNTDVTRIHCNDEVIEVKQYLPVNEKLELISKAISVAASMDSNSFINSTKLEIMANLEIVFAYTNLTFTDKQKEFPDKLYDLLDSSGLLNQIIQAIPSTEYNFLTENIESTAAEYYNYQNSLAGQLDMVMKNYSSSLGEIHSLEEAINDPNSLALLKEVMQKLG